MRVRPTLAVFLSATFLFCTGCRADFGDRAVAWVRDNARRYSHDLADADYAARWASHFTARQRQMTLLAQDIELNSAAVYTSLDEALTPQPDENVYEAALRQRAASRTSLDVLIATRVQIDELEQASADISAACQRSQFDRLGLAQVGSFGVAASFLGMADAVKQANRNRYGIYVGFTVVTDGNGEPMEPAGATEQLTHFARGISIYVEDIAAWLNEEEIEDQTQKVHEAIADFDRRVLRPDELYVLSRGHCRAEYLRRPEPDPSTPPSPVAVAPHDRRSCASRRRRHARAATRSSRGRRDRRIGGRRPHLGRGLRLRSHPHLPRAPRRG